MLADVPREEVLSPELHTKLDGTVKEIRIDKENHIKRGLEGWSIKREQ